MACGPLVLEVGLQLLGRDVVASGLGLGVRSTNSGNSGGVTLQIRFNQDIGRGLL